MTCDERDRDILVTKSSWCLGHYKFYIKFMIFIKKLFSASCIFNLTTFLGCSNSPNVNTESPHAVAAMCTQSAADKQISPYCYTTKDHDSHFFTMLATGMYLQADQYLRSNLCQFIV